MTMPTPDRALDAEVAEKVMGWIRRTIEANAEQLVTVPPDWTDFRTVRWWGHDINELVPPYSTDIAAAWQVVEHLFTEGWALNISAERGPGKPWDVRYWKGRERGMAFADTAPLAICRAALAATRPAAESDASPPAEHLRHD